MALQVALALSGLEPEGLFSCGLPKSSSSSSLASSSGTSSYYSTESGIASMSPDSVTFQHILTRSNLETLVLNALQHKSELNTSCKSDDEEEVRKEVIPPERVEVAAKQTIRHEKRNLLDLASNIMGGWEYQVAKLPLDQIGSYFENRSQYSRLMGAYPPHHTKNACKNEDCSFIEPIYI